MATSGGLCRAVVMLCEPPELDVGPNAAASRRVSPLALSGSMLLLGATSAMLGASISRSGKGEEGAVGAASRLAGGSLLLGVIGMYSSAKLLGGELGMTKVSSWRRALLECAVGSSRGRHLPSVASGRSRGRCQDGSAKRPHSHTLGMAPTCAVVALAGVPYAGLLRDVPRDALRCGHRVRGDARLAIGRVHHLTVQGRAQDEFCAVVDRRPRLCHLHGCVLRLKVRVRFGTRARLRRVARAVIHQPAGARADAQVRLSERFAAGGHEAAVHVSRLEAAYGDGGVAVGAHAVVDELLGDRVWLGALGVRDHARVPRVRDAHLPAQV
eukprot:7391666-Prymnesium_polylepis.2